MPRADLTYPQWAAQLQWAAAVVCGHACVVQAQSATALMAVRGASKTLGAYCRCGPLPLGDSDEGCWWAYMVHHMVAAKD
mmetsp:Transcript_71346/g.124837  ORF Transcript_71346/g.124837 Transcript_71346/m.124837 type:complete len:80 (-) Transcript_71346:75-314(-)